MSEQNLAYGGKLVNGLVDQQQALSLCKRCQTLASLTLSLRQLNDLELLLNGAFSPLTSFLTQEDYQSVLESACLANGTIWPMPIMLDVSQSFLDSLKGQHEIALRDQEGMLIALFEIDKVWPVDRSSEAQSVYATDDIHHPGVAYLYHSVKDCYVSGKLTGITLPWHYNFLYLRRTPQELRQYFVKMGWLRVIAFQTRNPMHKVHVALTKLLAERYEANLLIHPVIGQTQPGDINYFTRIRCYESVLTHYSEQTTLLSLLPLAMRMAGPREALWHAIIRQNYGCSHFIVGRDHAGPSYRGQYFYTHYAAHDFIKRYQDRLGIEIVLAEEMAYEASQKTYVPVSASKDPSSIYQISGKELRRRLREGIAIPDWFTYKEVVAELKKVYKPKLAQGFTLFITGLSAAGKTALAHAIRIHLLEQGGRQVTVLDGDVIRHELSFDLGFSREDREQNIMRVAYVAKEITKHGGIAICALIAPFVHIRQKVRHFIENEGGFIEVYVATPLTTCEKRDKKGLYTKARAGLIRNFTGIDSPYEEPQHAEITVDMQSMTIEEAAQTVFLYLQSTGRV